MFFFFVKKSTVICWELYGKIMEYVWTGTVACNERLSYLLHVTGTFGIMFRIEILLICYAPYWPMASLLRHRALGNFHKFRFVSHIQVRFETPSQRHQKEKQNKTKQIKWNLYHIRKNLLLCPNQTNHLNW